jgi:hypothetical protein
MEKIFSEIDLQQIVKRGNSLEKIMQQLHYFKNGIPTINLLKIASIDEFVKYAATENRFRQGIEQVFTIYGEKPDVKQTKKFITWVTNDIFKEESMTLTENKLIPEDVSKAIADKARVWFKGNLGSL